MEFNYGVPRYQVIPQNNTQIIPQKNIQIIPQINTQIIPQINTQIIPQINTQIIPQINTQMIPQRNVQIIPRMDTQMNAQVIIKPNSFCDINGKNNCFNQNIKQMGNGQILHNMGYYYNGNMSLNQNLLEKKELFYIFFKEEDSQSESMICIETSYDEKISKLLEKYRKVKCDNNPKKIFTFGGKRLNINLTCAESGLALHNVINVSYLNSIEGGGKIWYEKLINIKFIRVSKNNIYNNNNKEIIGLLKLCLLKEISQKISEDKLKALPDIVYYILKILLIGHIKDEPDDTKKNIKEVLEKSKGSNIITFSNYVDEIIDSQLINKILNLLEKKDLIEMIYLKNLLLNYNNCINLFNKEFIKAQKESIFEFSIISLVIIEREDFEKFEKEREKCPNRKEKILYHGTNIEKITNILTGLYKKSLGNGNAINGKGVYFTNSLDYAWYYGSQDGNRANFYIIPKIGNTFTIIMNYIYYDSNGIKKVNDNKRTPGKNQINYAYSGAKTERIAEYDKSKFYATEYIIYELDQICPFMSAKIERIEYCFIWRDDNFSSKPVYNSKYDEIFKSFLKERLKYINQYARYNIYPCETSIEALELVKRKKYNKIILISNVGINFGGKIFIDEARKIIGNNVITLFLAYDISHLNWIKNYENALFSNEPKFYEEYLQCFDKGYCESMVKNNIQDLIERLESHYKVKFNFNDKYLDYPLFLKEGKYEDLKF